VSVQFPRIFRQTSPMRSFVSSFTCLLALFGVAAAAHGQGAWTLTTADFQSQRVDLDSITAAEILVAPGTRQRSSPPEHIPFTRLLVLQRSERLAPVAAAPFIVNLNGGDSAAGQPLGVDAEKLSWMTPSLGKISLPLKNVGAIVRAGAAARSAPTTRQTDDAVELLNGDSLRGIIATLDATTITIQQPGGEKTPVPLESVLRITFASTAPPAGASGASAARPRGFRVSMTDGSAITCSRVQLARGADQPLQIVVASDPANTRSIPLAGVAAIEQVNGPVIWLSSIEPAESISNPMFDLPWPARMDRAVDGSPIRFGDRVFAHGIGVHSYSRLMFNIDTDFKSFRTQYAVAGDWSYANVNVRIKLDGKLVHEKTGFRSGQLAPPVQIDVSGHKQLILEVDYGQNYDVQDRFNWIEPAFLR